ncbi:hypothetical protein [Ramlibacter alkalitolerans]|uniref:Lipoprotein n=1 Tax=Ramlibacter alkalitolerans TaxID=2039631 RepID=A0ABS1JUC5_9BURK|nr:hypothetical protein [Ramlibacter alkalitolerans]MBL0427456.1 hypothetical protein [Ramlibacter alkalitolerans]
MSIMRRALLAACIPLVLAGCAGAPTTRGMSPSVASAIVPVELHVGIKQPELYAEFEHSNMVAGAAACGAIPGLGILLAAACGGAMGAMDANINAERAKAADETVRPLKDAIVDVKLDQLFNESITNSLRAVPTLKFSGMKFTKTVDGKAYEEVFRASTSAAVMFVNVDYHVAKDFASVEVSARGTVYPRSVGARKAAGKSPELPEQGKGAPLHANERAYQVDIVYRGALPKPGTAGSNIDEWKSGNARLLRAALEDGAQQVSRLLAEDLQRAPDQERPVLGKVDAAAGVMGDLLARENGSELIRMPTGALLYKTTLAPAPAQASSAGGAAMLQ